MNTRINPYFHVDFCNCDARTIRLPSVGLAQARPSKLYKVANIVYIYVLKFENVLVP